VLARRLFGRHVAGRAEDRRGVREAAAALDDFRETEIREMRLALDIDENIRGLEVTVQHAALMCVMNRARDKRHQFRGCA
jgi:hypothetical protein